MNERIDLLAVMARAEKLLPGSKAAVVTKIELSEARAAVAELIQAARDCNEWLCRTDREHTAHQRNLATALERLGAP